MNKVPIRNTKDCEWCVVVILKGEIQTEQPSCCLEKYQMSDIEPYFIFNVNYLLSLCPDNSPPHHGAQFKTYFRVTVALHVFLCIHCTNWPRIIFENFQELFPPWRRASWPPPPASTRTGSAASGSWTSLWGTARPSWPTGWCPPPGVTWGTAWGRAYPARKALRAATATRPVIVSIIDQSYIYIKKSRAFQHFHYKNVKLGLEPADTAHLPLSYRQL